jgi:hypothetical protein
MAAVSTANPSPMTYVIAVLIALFAGWSIAACDALFRAADRPGAFQGNGGMLLLLAATSAGGLVLAGAVIWVLRISPSASVAVIIGLFGLLGAKGSNMLNVSASGAANRMIVGIAGLAVLYGVAWWFYPQPPTP